MPNQQICPRPRGPSSDATMLTVDGVAALLVCSRRTVYRLVDADRIPRPVRIGGMIRWPREQFKRWIARGCPLPTGPKRRPGQVAENL